MVYDEVDIDQENALFNKAVNRLLSFAKRGPKSSSLTKSAESTGNSNSFISPIESLSPQQQSFQDDENDENGFSENVSVTTNTVLVDDIHKSKPTGINRRDSSIWSCISRQESDKSTESESIKRQHNYPLTPIITIDEPLVSKTDQNINIPYRSVQYRGICVPADSNYANYFSDICYNTIPEFHMYKNKNKNTIGLVEMIKTILLNLFNIMQLMTKLTVRFFSIGLAFREITMFAFNLMTLLFLDIVVFKGIVSSYEWILSRFGRVSQRLLAIRKELKEASTFAEWYALQQEYDFLNNIQSWVEKNELLGVELETLKAHTESLREVRLQENVSEIIFFLRSNVHRNFCGLRSLELYNRSAIKTKKTVQLFYQEVVAAIKTLDRIVSEDIGKPHPRLSVKSFLATLASLRMAHGRTALCLSGGGSLAIYHLGVIATLIDFGLLPNVINGTSGGSIVAGILATREDAELQATILAPNDKLEFKMLTPSLREQFHSLQRSGYILDHQHFTNLMRNMTGNYTFAEAYRKTGRFVSVTTTLAGRKTYDEPFVCNVINTPNVYIWSAICASCSLPLVLPPSALYSQSKIRLVENQRITPYSDTHFLSNINSFSRNGITSHGHFSLPTNSVESILKPQETHDLAPVQIINRDIKRPATGRFGLLSESEPASTFFFNTNSVNSFEDLSSENLIEADNTILLNQKNSNDFYATSVKKRSVMTDSLSINLNYKKSILQSNSSTEPSVRFSTVNSNFQYFANYNDNSNSPVSSTGQRKPIKEITVPPSESSDDLIRYTSQKNKYNCKQDSDSPTDPNTLIPPDNNNKVYLSPLINSYCLDNVSQLETSNVVTSVDDGSIEFSTDNYRTFGPKDLRFVDGSITQDIPRNELQTLFNVKSFIVSQVNPHLTPFIENLNYPNTNRVYFVSILHTIWNYLTLDLKNRYNRLLLLSMIPSIKGQDITPFWLQDAGGHVTITPCSAWKFWRLTKTPDEELLNDALLRARQKTWPHVLRIKNMLCVENALRECWKKYNKLDTV